MPGSAGRSHMRCSSLLPFEEAVVEEVEEEEEEVAESLVESGEEADVVVQANEVHIDK